MEYILQGRSWLIQIGSRKQRGMPIAPRHNSQYKP